MSAYPPFRSGDLKNIYLRNLWTKNVYRFLRDFFVNVQSQEGYSEIIKHWGNTGEAWIFPTGGGDEETTSFAFQISAELQENETYTATVLGGSAQVLGGAEYVYGDTTLTGLSDGDYIYIRYQMWDSEGVAVCEWDEEIHSASSVPSETATPKSLIFALGRVGAAYVGGVNQFRVGSIQAVALVNSSPGSDALAEIEP